MMSPNRSQVRDSKPGRGKRSSLLDLFLAAFLGLLIGILLLSLLVGRPPHRMSPRLACMMNLRQLGLCLDVYAKDHGQRYPPPERWCDTVVSVFGPKTQDIQKLFRCPEVRRGPCDYTMNPHATPHSSHDVVLLFESRPGWNQSGGPALLTTENHRREGCNVLFADLHVEFVKTGYLATLRWKDADTMDANRPRDVQRDHCQVARSS
mgnify:CR=1 FL=1